MAGRFDRLDLAYARAVRQLKDRLSGFAVAVFTRGGAWRDGDADRFVALLAPTVLAGQRQVAGLTDAWLSRRLSAQLGRPVRITTPPDRVTGRAVRDVDPDEMWRRPYVKVRTELAAGKSLTDAVNGGQVLVGSLVATGLQLAKTHTFRAGLSGTDGVVGYRRVLTGSQSCALCYVASMQRYFREDLLPIHPNCNCDVAPIVAGEDPGQVLDPDLLEGTHEAISQRFGAYDRGARAPDYRKVLLVREHGELGPVLTVASHRFTHL